MAIDVATLDDVRALMARATGDEKHEESTHLDARCALGALRPDPARRPRAPDAEDRDRFILSKGHGPDRALRDPGREGVLPAGVARRVPRARRTPRLASGPHSRCPASRPRPGRSATGSPMAVGVALALRARVCTSQRVVVLCGDAELNEGSNWEAILLAPHARLGNLTLLVDRQPQLGRSPMAPWARAARRVRLGRARRWTGTTTTRSKPRSPPATTRVPIGRHRGHPGG